MAILRVDDFKQKLKFGGARPNLFEVDVTFPGYSGGNTETTNFMCRAAQLPGSTVGVIPVPFRGRQVKVAGDRTFEPWTITCFNDHDFVVRNGFEKWMDGINQHQAGTGFINPLIYATQMKVYQLNRVGARIKEYTLVGCFPSLVAPIELSYDANDQIEEFQVTIEFDYWTSNTTS